jgi:hypothetical protein
MDPVYLIRLVVRKRHAHQRSSPLEIRRRRLGYRGIDRAPDEVRKIQISAAASLDSPSACGIRPTPRRFLKRSGRTYSGYFLVSNRGTAFSDNNARASFRELLLKAGLYTSKQGGPRIHDLRHRFAVETLRRWYQAGEQVEHRLPALSTYLGHVNVASTYWYLSCTPELAAAASERIEARWKGVTQ